MSDASAFRDIYEAYKAMVYNLALNYVQNSGEAEEITQDVFVKVYQKLSKFREEASLKTWIYRITVNQCLDAIKARKAEKRSGWLSLFSNAKEASLPETPDFYHPGIELESKEAYERLFGMMNRLPEQQKTALLLKTTESLSVREIAGVMQLSEKAVESLLSRAKSNLKEQMNRSKDR